MTMRVCERESEVLAAVRGGMWPTGCAEELRVHVGGCAKCGELAVVGAAFQAERAAAVMEARVGSAGVVWWRAQVRRRQAAMEAVARPMWGAQMFALAVALVMLVVAGVVWVPGLQWDAVWAMVSGSAVLLCVAAGVVVMVGVVGLSLALGREDRG